MKNASIILEGGAVRGVFTSGALDYLMDQDYYIKNVIGVSAGSCNAVGYVSKQKGRTKECIIRHKEDGQLINIKNAIKNKSLFDMELLFEIDPNERHPFDYDTFFASEMNCEIVVTNCETGKAEYLTERSDRKRLMNICRASSSIPLVSPMVELDGKFYLDGGLADSIPIVHALKQGIKKNVIILTRNKGYRKTISRKSIAFCQAAFSRYPQLAKAICLRAHNYNQILSYIEKWEDEGKIFVVRPENKTVSRTESNPEKLMDFYNHGYEQMEKQFEDLKKFLKNS